MRDAMVHICTSSLTSATAHAFSFTGVSSPMQSLQQLSVGCLMKIDFRPEHMLNLISKAKKLVKVHTVSLEASVQVKLTT